MAISSAYIAGFLDGEGHITILERNRYSGYSSYGLHVGFTNRDLRPLKSIQEIYGGNIFAKKRRSQRHAQAFELRVSKKEDVRRMLEDIAPHLICKRQQAELGLSFLSLGKVKMVVTGRRQLHAIKGGSAPIRIAAPGEQESRKELKARLMLLNARGAA